MNVLRHGVGCLVAICIACDAGLPSVAQENDVTINVEAATLKHFRKQMEEQIIQNALEPERNSWAALINAANILEIKDARLNQLVTRLVRSEKRYESGIALMSFSTLTGAERLELLIDALSVANQTVDLYAKAKLQEKDRALNKAARNLVRGRDESVSWSEDEMVEFFERRLAGDDVRVPLIELVAYLQEHRVTFLPRLVQLAEEATQQDSRDAALLMAASIVSETEGQLADLNAAQQQLERKKKQQQELAKLMQRNGPPALPGQAVPVLDKQKDKQEASIHGNGDQVAADAELPAGVEIDERLIQYARRILERYDKNGDGLLTPSESKSMLMAPKNADINGDGAVSVAEFAYSFAVRRKR